MIARALHTAYTGCSIRQQHSQKHSSGKPSKQSFSLTLSTCLWRISKVHNKHGLVFSVKNWDGQPKRHETGLQPEPQLFSSTALQDPHEGSSLTRFFNYVYLPRVKTTLLCHIFSLPLRSPPKKLQLGTVQLCSNTDFWHFSQPTSRVLT